MRLRSVFEDSHACPVVGGLQGERQTGRPRSHDQHVHWFAAHRWCRRSTFVNRHQSSGPATAATSSLAGLRSTSSRFRPGARRSGLIRAH